jgi:hypothetical protein
MFLKRTIELQVSIQDDEITCLSADNELVLTPEILSVRL